MIQFDEHIFQKVGSTTNKNSLNQGHLVVTMVLRRWIWRKQKMKDIILTKAAMPGPLGGFKKKQMLHGNSNIYPRGSMGRTVYLPAFSWFVCMVNVGKYTNQLNAGKYTIQYMDPMGTYIYH